jgi:Tfp pilus assembly protein PilF
MNKILKSLSVSAVAILALSFQTIAQTVQDGLKNLDAERYNAAETIFKQLTTSAPSAENYFYEGYYYLNLQDGQMDLPKAKAAFEKGAALDSRRPDALCRVGLASIKLFSGDKAGAKADFDQIKKDTRNKNADVMFRIGEVYTLSEKINDPAEAVLNIQAGLDLQKVKDDPNYYIAMANAYLIKNDGGSAMTALENALRMGQKVAKIKTLMAKVWYQGKQYPRVQELLNDAINADAKYAPAYALLSSLYTTFGKYDLAAKNALLALENSEATTAAKVKYVKLATASKDYDGALKVLNDVFEVEKDPIKYRLKGYILAEKDQCADAVKNIQEFLKVAEKDRQLGSDYGIMGKAYTCIKDEANQNLNDSLAVMNMEIAIQKQDSTYDYLKEIGNIYKKNKNWAKLAATYEKAIAGAAKPNGADYYNLADAYLRSADYVKADSALSKTIVLYKNTWMYPYILKARVKQYALTNDSTFVAAPVYEDYIKYSSDAEKAKESNKKYFSEAYGYLGYKALLIDKDSVKATEFMNEALKYDPTNTKAQEVLNSINGTPATPNSNPPNGATTPKN